MDEGGIGELLGNQRRHLAHELERLTARPADQAGTVSFGKRIGDGTTEAVERINTTAAARSLSATLAEVDRALAKLAEGSYAVCDGCGRSIPPDRLDAVPWATRCVTCSAKRG
jgi:RNA polymerase-binding transcription factor